MISPAFVVLVVISCALWFISRLSHTYTSQITIPVELVTDYSSDVWVGTTQLSVRTLVKGDGRDIILYKFGLGPKVVIPVSSLQLVQSDQNIPYLYSVVEKSMERALSSEQSRFTVMMITDTIEQVKLSAIGEARLPVVSQIEVDCAPQYMVRGRVQLKPDSMTIKAPLAILDTMLSIKTEPLTLEQINSLQSDAISLIVPDNVVVPASMVRYLIDVVGYTEQRYTLPITSADRRLVIPAQTQVVVRVPLNVSYPKSVELSAAVEISDSSHKYSRVAIHGLPEQAIIMSIEPEFVETYTVE